LAGVGALDPKIIELNFWDSIKDSKSPDDFQAYLQKYPDGDFASLAKIRLKQLGQGAKAKPAAAPAEAPSDVSADFELAFWNSVKDSSEAEDYQAYLRKYPSGSFADLARAKIASLDKTRSESPAPSAAASPAPAPSAAPEALQLVVRDMDATFVARQLANVRAEPSTASKIVARLKEDDAVAVTGKVDGKDWYRVSVGGDAGYVSASLLQQADPQEIADWQAARQARTVAAVQAFQAGHPHGVFADKARQLLAALQPPPPQPAQPPKPAQAAAPAPQPATTAAAPEQQASLATTAAAPPAPQSDAPQPAAEGIRVGDVYDLNARGTVGLYGNWWGNTRVVLKITK
jgi:uncharacterized protein YgiM (DUF1202 family)